MKPAVRLDWAIVTRAQKKKKKVPGHKLHNSAANVMAYLGCSRATPRFARSRQDSGFLLHIPPHNSSRTRPK
jgi:hypothetical protein